MLRRDHWFWSPWELWQNWVARELHDCVYLQSPLCWSHHFLPHSSFHCTHSTRAPSLVCSIFPNLWPRYYVLSFLHLDSCSIMCSFKLLSEAMFTWLRSSPWFGSSLQHRSHSGSFRDDWMAFLFTCVISLRHFSFNFFFFLTFAYTLYTGFFLGSKKFPDLTISMAHSESQAASWAIGECDTHGLCYPGKEEIIFLHITLKVNF